MSFKDLTTWAAALLKSKPAEPVKKEPAIKVPDSASVPDRQDQKAP